MAFNTLNLTLTMIAVLESTNGKDVNHPVIRNPASIHYGESAQGTFGLMPKTIKEFGGTEERAAVKLARYILARNGNCPLQTAVVSWEQGQNIKVSTKHWHRGNAPQRLKKALLLWKGTVKRTKHAGVEFYVK